MSIFKYLNSKIRESYRFVRESKNTSKPIHNQWEDIMKELKTGSFLNYKAELTEPTRNEWKVFLNPNFYIRISDIPRDRKKRKLMIIISRNGKSSSYYANPEIFISCVKQMPELYNETESIWKQIKINDLTRKSILAWVDKEMKSTSYKYYCTTEDNKVLLSIKMNKGLQLNIPIYLNKFQEIMPQLMDVIKDYETTINRNKVRVLISNQTKNRFK